MRVFDFHNDFLTADKPFDLMCEYEKTSNKIVSAIFKGSRSVEEVKDLVNCFLKFNPQSCYLAFEDISYDRHTIDILLDCSPICVSLTWNNENYLAVGCKASGGLKKDGIQVIDQCNKKNIAVDTAHLNKQSFFEVVEKSDYPVNTHSCFDEVSKHDRNLDDEQLKAIIKKGGLIGLNFYTEFLCREQFCDGQKVFEHIDYFCQKFSYENLCIGSDFYGCDSFPKDINDYESLDGIDYLMDKAGYSQNVRQKIFFGNLEKYTSKLLKTRLQLKYY